MYKTKLVLPIYLLIAVACAICLYTPPAVAHTRPAAAQDQVRPVLAQAQVFIKTDNGLMLLTGEAIDRYLKNRDGDHHHVFCSAISSGGKDAGGGDFDPITGVLEFRYLERDTEYKFQDELRVNEHAYEMLEGAGTAFRTGHEASVLPRIVIGMDNRKSVCFSGRISIADGSSPRHAAVYLNNDFVYHSRMEGDSEGRFSGSAPTGKYSLKFSAIKAEDKYLDLVLTKDTEMNVVLDPVQPEPSRDIPMLAITLILGFGLGLLLSKRFKKPFHKKT